MRSIGTIETVQALVPDALVVAFVALSRLGDPATFPLVLVGIYWFLERDRAVRLLGVVLGGLALVVVLKWGFALPRPPRAPPVPIESVPDVLAPVYRDVIDADGYGFPSGHATGATVVWGAIATGLSALAVVVSAGSVESTVALGGAVALAAVALTDAVPRDPWPRSRASLVPALAGLAGAAGVAGGTALVVGTSPVGAFVATALGTAVVAGLPAVVSGDGSHGTGSDPRG